jgi:hypothetical protein
MASKLVKKWFCGQDHHGRFHVASAMFRETPKQLRLEEIADADRCLLHYYTLFVSDMLSLLHDTPEAAKAAKIRELDERIEQLQGEIGQAHETIEKIAAVKLPKE